MYFTNSVFVIDKSGKPLKPCHPAVARKLQASGKAKQIRLYPNTIALQKDIDIEVITTLELRIDPGSKFTGFAIVDISDNSIIWGMELKHRRNAIFTMVGKLNLPLVAGNGACTKMVRVQSNLPKEHWIDAGCVATELPVIVKAVQPLRVSSVGNGNRQYRRPNAHGFPDITVKKDKETGKKLVSAIHPKKEYKHATAGDVVKVNLKKARKNVAAGIYTARVKTPTINGTRLGVEVKINNHRISVGMSNIQPVHRSDGYAYEFAPINSALRT